MSMTPDHTPLPDLALSALSGLSNDEPADGQGFETTVARSPGTSRVLQCLLDEIALLHQQNIELRAHTVDAVTGLPIRAVWETTARQRLAEYPEHTTLILADLDHFKHINESLGHPGADTVLRGVADRLRSTLQDREPAITRVGGDEFGIICQGNLGPADLNALTEAIQDSIPLPGGGLLHVQASFGMVSSAALPHPVSLSAALRAADQSLYDAKRRHHNDDHAQRTPCIRSTGVRQYRDADATGSVPHHEGLGGDDVHHLTTFVRALRAKWTPAILIALAHGPLRRHELLTAVRAGSGDDYLQGSIFDRTLRRLHHEGVLQRTEDHDWPRRVRYGLSPAARDLLIAAIPGIHWSQHHDKSRITADPASRTVAKACMLDGKASTPSS